MIPQTKLHNEPNPGDRFGFLVILERIPDWITPSNRRLPRFKCFNARTGEFSEHNLQNLRCSNATGKKP